MKPKKNLITRKDLMKDTSAPYWVIAHMTLTNQLPRIHKAMGKGDSNIYHPHAIQIVKDYLKRNEDNHE
jgi:hypothetical protein